MIPVGITFKELFCERILLYAFAFVIQLFYDVALYNIEIIVLLKLPSNAIQA